MESSIMEYGHVHWCPQGCQTKNQNIMANSVDPDEMAHHEPSHQDLHYLQRYLVCSVGLKGFKTLCVAALWRSKLTVQIMYTGELLCVVTS